MIALLVWTVMATMHIEGRRRRALTARASHDVRGPLCTARLALDGLERSARVEAIELELRRAALALDDLARGRDSGRRLEAFDLGGLVRAAEPAWQALASAGGATLSVARGQAQVVGDPLRVAHACANLVSNAVEHGGGAVDVHVSSSNGRVALHVRDSGPGLPAPLPTLLAAARGRRTTRGHGLAIAAGIARRHDGRLLALPTTTGAHLVLELPAARRPS